MKPTNALSYGWFGFLFYLKTFYKIRSSNTASNDSIIVNDDMGSKLL
jgi:hypothetical protein